MHPAQEKVSKMFHVYNDERRREAFARNSIRWLTESSGEILEAKLALIQKLVDIRVKDQLSDLRNDASVGFFEDAAKLKKIAKKRLVEHVHQNAEVARETLGNKGFVPQFEALSRKTEEDDVLEVSHALNKFVNEQMQQMHNKRTQLNNNTTHLIDLTKTKVIDQQIENVRDSVKTDVTQRYNSLAFRVKSAQLTLKKPLGDLSCFLNGTPIQHKTSIGALEAEVYNLKEQCLENARNERQMWNAAVEREKAMLYRREDLETEIERAENLYKEMRKEIARKEEGIDEIMAAEEPISGKWDVLQTELENKLEEVLDEEELMKDEFLEIKQRVKNLMMLRSDLEGQVEVEKSELQHLDTQNKNLAKQMENQILHYKRSLLDMRHKGKEHLGHIHHMRRDMYNSEDSLSAHRNKYKRAITQHISDMLLEDKLQELTVNKQQQLLQDTSQVQDELNQRRQELLQGLQRSKRDLQQKEEHLSTAIDSLVDIRVQNRLPNDVPKMDISVLQEQIAETTREWDTLEHNKALRISGNAAKILLANKMNHQLFDRLGHLVMKKEELNSLGIDPELCTTDQLNMTLENLKSNLSKTIYQQGKLKILVNLLQQHVESSESSSLIPSSSQREKRNSRLENKLKRIAEDANSTTMTTGTTVTHTTAPTTTTTSGTTDTSGHISLPLNTYIPPPSSTDSEDHTHTTTTDPTSSSRTTSKFSLDSIKHTPERKMVINSIKREIQPLYDEGVLNDRQYRRVVAHVEAVFLQQHYHDIQGYDSLTPSQMHQLHQLVSQALQKKRHQ